MVIDDNENRTELGVSLGDEEKYLLRNQGSIVSSLKELARGPDIITGYFGNNNHLLTAVLAVLPERQMVVLDRSSDEGKNDALTQATSLLCVARHNDIPIRFRLEGVQSARYQGERVFAAPLPDALYRLQRREFFRVKTPVAHPATCTLNGDDGRALTLPLHDISAGGLCLTDETMRLTVEVSMQFDPVTLHLPDFGDLPLRLEVRNSYEKTIGHRTVRRIGLAFLQLPMDRLAVIQRYIHKLQVDQKNIIG